MFLKSQVSEALPEITEEGEDGKFSNLRKYVKLPEVSTGPSKPCDVRTTLETGGEDV
jgi:hypothetical protein